MSSRFRLCMAALPLFMALPAMPAHAGVASLTGIGKADSVAEAEVLAHADLEAQCKFVDGYLIGSPLVIGIDYLPRIKVSVQQYCSH